MLAFLYGRIYDSIVIKAEQISKKKISKTGFNLRLSFVNLKFLKKTKHDIKFHSQ